MSMRDLAGTAREAEARKNALERFMMKVDRSGECWIWTAQLDRHGYPRLSVDGRLAQGHRFAYSEFVGPLIDGLEVDHICHNSDPSCPGSIGCLHRRCVNPEHLEQVTHRVNGLRGRSVAALNARKTHCDRGHPFDSSNTYYGPSDAGRRTCRACNREAVRQYKARKKAATSAPGAVKAA